MVSLESMKTALEVEVGRHHNAFDDSVKEIATLLYQNIWNNFLERETELKMGAEVTFHEKGKVYPVVLDK
jgi:hypothetical protein